jgi:ribosomal protein S18 acetylase RimI-like enzyme
MQIRLFNKRDTLEVRKVFQLQQASYAVEAHFLNAKMFPPLSESIHDLQTSGDEGFVCVLNNELVGAIFLEKSRGSILISKLIVDPKYFRNGIGIKLVEHALNLYPQAPFRVSTGSLNIPAVRLYQKLGFRIESEKLVEFEIRIVQMVREVWVD